MLTPWNQWIMHLMPLNDYISFIEKETGVPVEIVSIGPDRKQTLFR